MADDKMASDADLARRAAGGDREAFAELFRLHRATVYRYARHMSGCASTADDVVQDVFVGLLRSIGRFDSSRATFSTYLYGVTRHVVMQALHRQRSRVMLDIGDVPESEGRVATYGDLDETLATAGRLDALRRALLVLPVHHREVLVLCDLDERSYEDAAHIIGCPVGTVRSRLSRARASLARNLEPERRALVSVARLTGRFCG